MSFYGEHEDIVAPLRAEISALREELHRERLKSERLEDEISNLYRAAQAATRDNLELRQRLQVYIDEADAEIQLAALRRAEAEALGL
jgi:predicted RNase H-like nuclease (RuvC/YqgF family)